MMNKIFAGLLALTIVGAGILFWLMRSLPQQAGDQAHDPTKPLAEVHTTDSGVKIVEKGDGVHTETPIAGEKPEHGAEHSPEAAASGDHSDAEKKADDELHALDQAKKKTNAPRLNITTIPVPAMVFVDGELAGQTPTSIELTAKPQTIKLEAAHFQEVMRESPTIKEAKEVENLNWRITLKEGSSAKAISSVKKVKSVDDHQVEKKAPEKSEDHAHAKTTVASAKPVSADASHKVEDQAEHKTEAKAVVKTEPKTADDELFFQGRGGPVWIQVKALSPEESSDVKMYVSNLKARTKEPVVACRVAIKGKGQWTRILVGPFDNKVSGANALATLKPMLNATVESGAFVTGVQECL